MTDGNSQARFTDIAGTLRQIEHLADEMEVQLSVLRINAQNYAEAVLAAKQAGATAPTFSGSEEQILVNKLVPRIKAAANQVGFIGGEMVRFGP